MGLMPFRVETRNREAHEGLYLVVSLAVAAVWVSLGILWSIPPAHLWQDATETALAGAFAMAFGLFMRSRGERRPWLLPVLAFFMSMLGQYAFR